MQVFASIKCPPAAHQPERECLEWTFRPPTSENVGMSDGSVFHFEDPAGVNDDPRQSGVHGSGAAAAASRPLGAGAAYSDTNRATRTVM